MALFAILLILTLVLFGAGFALKWLWIAAVILLIIALWDLLMTRRRR